MPSTLTLGEQLTCSLYRERLHAVRRRIAELDALEAQSALTIRLSNVRSRLRRERAELVASLITDAPKGGE